MPEILKLWHTFPDDTKNPMYGNWRDIGTFWNNPVALVDCFIGEREIEILISWHRKTDLSIKWEVINHWLRLLFFQASLVIRPLTDN